MGIVFKYKNKSNLSYAPGLASPGIDGSEGKQGISGNTVYFVDYDLDNSYSIQLALQRIENNQILSSLSNKNISSRPYKENDLLISKNRKVYKIVLAPVTSAQNYKYDIQYLGSIRDKAIPPISKVVMYYSGNDTDCSLKLFLTLSFEDVTDEETIYKNYKNLIDNYSFSLSIYLNNKKSLIGESVPTDVTEEKTDPTINELYKTVDFYKKLEFVNLIPVQVPVDYVSDYNDLLAREQNVINAFNLVNIYDNSILTTSANILNDSLNRLHPSGNDIRFTAKMGQDSAVWYNNGADSSDNIKNTIGVVPLGDAYEFPYLDEETAPTPSDVKFTKYQFSDLKYYYNGAADNSTGITELSSSFVEMFPENAVGHSLTTYTKDTAQEQLDKITENNSTNILQFSKKKINNQLVNNLTSGFSMYFSSSENKEIFDFLCNTKNNKYIITVKNKKTHEIYTVEASTEFINLT